MKKLLIASTALVASAGMAAADVTLKGSSRFGLIYTEGAADETVIHNRFTLNIDASVETDSGAEFFSRVRVRGGNSTGAGGTTSASGVSAPRVGMRTNGFTLAVGNIYGGIESTPGLYDGAVGLTGLGDNDVVLNLGSFGDFFWDSFSSSGGGANGVEVIYENAGFTVHLSMSDVNDEVSAHVAYAFGDWTVALGAVDDSDDGEEAVVATVGGSMGSIIVGASLADIDGDTAASIYGTLPVGAATNITAFVTTTDATGVDDTYGLGFEHSLGGATLAGGVVNDVSGRTLADLGVRFSF